MRKFIRGAIPVSEDRFQHAEGPLWDVENSRLLLVDMLAGNLVSFDFADGSRSPRASVVHIDDVLAFIRPRRGGGWIAVSADSVLTLNAAFEVVRRRQILHDPRIRFNEGGCDVNGFLYAGTMAYDATPGAGALYRFGPSLIPDVIVSDVTVSNGFASRPNSADFYYVDSATRRIDILTLGVGLPKRQPFVALETDAGYPDGLTVDTDGGVWVALWSAGRVRRYNSSGALTHEVGLPTTQVTSCAFGGAENSTLFITTSQIETAYEDALAGAVFSLQTDFQGIAVERSIV